MRYFLDTEFMEDGKTIDLVSIGIVADDGREYYAVNGDADLSNANSWVKEHVLPHLYPMYARPRDVIKAEVADFIRKGDGKPEIWGYYADYDWVVFCQLFGKMVDLPDGFPMYCRDVKQLCDELGGPRLPIQTNTKHHALDDARWIRDGYNFLRDLDGKRPQGTPDPNLREAADQVTRINNEALKWARHLAVLGEGSCVGSKSMVLEAPLNRPVFGVCQHGTKWDVYVFGQQPYHPITDLDVEFKAHFIMQAPRLEREYLEHISEMMKLMRKALAIRGNIAEGV